MFFFFQLNLLPPYSLGSQGKNNNNLMIFKWVLLDDFHSMLLQDLQFPRFSETVKIEFHMVHNKVLLVKQIKQVGMKNKTG